jgi:pimeloyl-ACP methyl ester carboxylesterase
MIVYLHGFASGPESYKGRFLAERFAAMGVEVLRADLTPGADGFERSTPSSMLAEVESLLARAAGPHTLLGSSLGGYLAALAASRSPAVDRLVLLAPAFRLAQRWKSRMTAEQLQGWEREGLETFHYATNRPRRLGWEFLRDAERWPDFPAVKVPTLCLAGRRDEVVPLQVVEEFVARTPSARLVVLDDEHELTASVERIWEEARGFVLGR